MINNFITWLGTYNLNVTDDIIFIFASISSLIILQFVLDIIKFLLYYVIKR